MKSIAVGAQSKNRWIALVGALVLIATTTGLVATNTKPAFANPAPVQVGFVPLPADQLQAVMGEANSNADTTLDFTVGITSTGPGAVITYDEWEDGYEADIANPVQSTTKVYGDGNTSNGDASSLCSVCTGDHIPQGAVLTGRNSISTPRNSSQILFDGRDEVASTRAFALTAGGFSTPLGSVLSGSVSAFDTSKYGTDYVVPVGTDTAVPSGTSSQFSYTGAVVMAAQNSTTVQIDTDGDGTFDQSQTINKGGVAFINGGLQEGAHIVTSKPVQVHLATAAIGATYASRWFTLFPTPLLSSDYLSPVGSNVDNQRTIVYLHNPGASSITITPTCAGCSGTIALAAHSTTSFATPLGQAVRFASSGNAPFIGIGASGAQSGAAPGTSGDNSAKYDWGYTLVPTSLLTTQAVLGWAPGNSTNPPSSAGAGDSADNPVWITSLTSTTLHVDYDGDPSTGAISAADCAGAKHDAEITVGALSSTRITDSSDSDMTGASIYTCDGTKLAAAWGEDPENAPTGSPGFDAGYTVIPATTMIVGETGIVSTDANSDAKAGPGDTVTYEISVSNIGGLPLTSVDVTGTVPAGTTFVSGSTEYDNGTSAPVADDGVSGHTIFPLDEGGLSIPDIPGGATVKVRYKVLIKNPYPSSTNTLTNPATVVTRETSGSATNVMPLATSDLSLAMTETASPAHPGDNAVFHLTLTNAGPDSVSVVKISDVLPNGLAYVSDNGSGSYNSTTGVWSVGTLASGASISLDITATVNVLSATNSAEVVASGSVDPDSQPAEDLFDGGHAADQDDEASVAVSVAANGVLGNTVWNDTNGNGTIDSGEAGISGVLLTITGAGVDGTFSTSDDTTTSRTTDSSGNWSVTGLTAGQYRVSVDTSTLPSGVDQETYDFDGTSTADVATVTLSNGQTHNDIDFGYRTTPVPPSGVLGNTVWNDLDGNGVMDSGESGISNVGLTITGAGVDATFGTSDDTTTSRTTDPSGNWSVTGLVAGQYRVTVDPATLPTGIDQATYDLDGTSTADVATVTLSTGQTHNDVNFGYRATPMPPTPPPSTTTTTAPPATTTTTAAPVAPGFDVQISNRLLGSPKKGQTAKYVLTVTNNGPATADALTVVDVLPPNVSFVSATGTGWTCVARNQVVGCTHDAGLADGDATSIDIVVNALADASSITTNSATVSSLGDTDSTNNEANVASRQLAVTGADIARWVLMGGGALLLGAALLAMARASRRKPDADFDSDAGDTPEA